MGWYGRPADSRPTRHRATSRQVAVVLMLVVEQLQAPAVEARHYREQRATSASVRQVVFPLLSLGAAH